MNKTPWTPGPWKIHAPGAFSPTKDRWVITSPISPDPGTRARYTVLGELASAFDGEPLWEYPSRGELSANAALIALAPEMAEALRALVALTEPNAAYKDMTADERSTLYCNTLNRAKAVIARLPGAAP